MGNENLWAIPIWPCGGNQTRLLEVMLLWLKVVLGLGSDTGLFHIQPSWWCHGLCYFSGNFIWPQLKLSLLCAAPPLLSLLLHPQSPSHSLRPTLSSTFSCPLPHSILHSIFVRSFSHPPTLPRTLAFFFYFSATPFCQPCLHLSLSPPSALPLSSSPLFPHNLWLSFQTDFIPKQL